MRFRHKSASLMLIGEDEYGCAHIYQLEASQPGQGHAGSLLRSVVAMLPGRWISLRVAPYGPKWMAEPELRAFYGRCGFKPDDRPGFTEFMWVYP